MLHTQTRVEEPFMQHNAGQKPSSSFLPNGQMHGEDRVERHHQAYRGPEERETLPCPASIHQSLEKSSDWPGLSHVPIPAPITVATWVGYCDWSLLSHMLLPLLGGRWLIDNQSRTTESGEGANKKEMKGC